MKSFTKFYSDFWINPDNTALMQLGTDAKLMAIYLQGNAHNNMLGVYYLPLLYAASDLKQSVKKVRSTLEKLCNLSYCQYDEQTQYIWVCNMALEQLGEEIDAKDNRIKAMQTIWNSLPQQISFLLQVYAKYHRIFNLKSRYLEYSTINSNAPSLDGRQPSSLSAVNRSSSNFTSSFEGVTSSQPLQSPPTTSLEAPLKELAILSETPSEPLRSNIEDRSENIEEINNKTERDLQKIEKEEEKRIKKKTNHTLAGEKTGAVDAKKQPTKLRNLPVVTLAPKLETNLAPVFSVATHRDAAHGNATAMIFEHWQTTMNHPKSKLDSSRSSWISKALKMGYSVQQLCNAITGCSLTPHNMGDNERGERYDGLHIILKNADQIDRFIRNFHHPPRKESETQQRSRRNIQVAQTWAEQKNYQDRNNYV